METGMGRETGGGEVHSRISSHPHSDTETGGGSGMGEGSGTEGMMGQAREQAGQLMEDARGGMDDMRGQAEEMAGAARDRATEMMDEARDRVGDLPDRAGEMMGQARDRAGEMMDRAQESLEERTGAISRVRDNPLPALGLAFAAGFLLAGGGEKGGRKGRGVMNKAMHQMTGAVMGGISAAIAQELRKMAGQGGRGGSLGEMMQSFLGGQQGDDRGSTQSSGQDTPRAGV